MVYKSLNIIQDWLFGGNCELCGAVVKSGLVLCRECENSLIRLRNHCTVCADTLDTGIEGQLCGRCQIHPPAYDRVSAALCYDDPVSQLILDLKYNNKLYLAPVLGNILTKHIIDQHQPLPEVLLPVPLHRARLRRRGYNQSLEIARPVGRQLGIKIDSRLVTRTRNTEPQSSLRPNQRARNVRRAFKIIKPVDGQSIALIDDVMTTGHTANALAEVLKKAGAKEVLVWVVARA